MEFIGELERAFATSLYPLRVPIAIALFVGFIGLVLLARRKGWASAARRHPGRTAVLVVLLLVVGLPTGWYLGSPLFIRTSLMEPEPSAAPTSPATTAAPTIAAPASTGAPAVVRRGSFAGADEFHFGMGTASLIQTAPGTWIVRFEDFSVRNGPDLYVYLSPEAEGYADGVVELGPLKATDGDYNMAVPPGTAVDKLHSVVIWCKQFAVQFAVAPLN